MVGDPGIDELVADLSASIGLLVRRLRQRKADGELTMPESTCLSRLDREGPATSSALAKQEQISPQSMGATLAGLEERGLVERRPDPEDGRKVVMSLTAPGRRALEQRRAAGTDAMARALATGFTAAGDRAAPRRRTLVRTTGPGLLMAAEEDPSAKVDDHYRWVALANTTAAVFMSTLDGSIVIIALPAIFRGIHLDPLAPGNIVYLLWMIMGYRLVQAVTVVTFGRLGDMFGRVRIYNAGFVVFTVSSILLSVCPFLGVGGAQWLIGWRLVQALGGSMLTANSVAILTDAFPSRQRGFALGLNQVAALAGMFVGLVAGGLLAAVNWRLVFWVNVPVGVFGTLWAYWKLREISDRQGGRIDWWGNLTFAVGLGAILVGVTYGIQPYGHHAQGWTSPAVDALLIGGALLLGAFVVIETRVADPLFQLTLFRIRAFTAGNIAAFAVSVARGGLQFVLIIWLQGIWLPLHGYSYSQTPLWAGIFLLPLTAGFLVSGPLAGTLSDRFGSRGMATAGTVVFGGASSGCCCCRWTSRTGPSRCSSPPAASAAGCSPRPTRHRS